jgi:hypothetical protein
VRRVTHPARRIEFGFEDVEKKRFAEIRIVPSVSYRTKANFAIHHLLASAYFARKCGETERTRRSGGWAWQDVPATLREEHLSCAVGAVVLSAAFLEAGINEVYLDAIDRNSNTFSDSQAPRVAALANEWSQIEKTSVLDKYQKALELSSMPTFDRGNAPYQPVDSLIKLRDALMHFKPEWHDQQEGHLSLEQRLKSRFAESALSAPSQVYFPHRCLGHGCAQWCVETARTFMREFRESPYVNRLKTD